MRRRHSEPTDTRSPPPSDAPGRTEQCAECGVRTSDYYRASCSASGEIYLGRVRSKIRCALCHEAMVRRATAQQVHDSRPPRATLNDNDFDSGEEQ